VQIDAILRSAPRHWLFSRLIAEAEAELKLKAEERARAHLEKQHEALGKFAASLGAAYQVQSEEGHPGWAAAVNEAGLASLVGDAISGDGCFRMPASVWQSAIIHEFVLGQSHYYGEFLPQSVTEWLVSKSFLKAAFAELLSHSSDEMTAYLAAEVKGFRWPVAVVEEFMTALVRDGLLSRSRGRWTSLTPAGDEARQRRDRLIHGRQRVTQLAAQIDTIKKAALKGTAIDFATWASERHAGMAACPQEIAMDGGIPFDGLVRGLQSLRLTLAPGGYPSTTLLGLPLEDDQAARRRELDERTENMRVERERSERLATQHRRAKTAAFLTEIAARANELLGQEAGTEWYSRKIAPDMVELTQDQMDSQRRALDGEHRRELAKWQAQITKKKYLKELQQKASYDPELRSPERLELWLSSTQPNLEGRRPRDFCVDQKTLEECLAVLPSRLPKKARGTRR
jgi:hypothetical protein